MLPIYLTTQNARFSAYFLHCEHDIVVAEVAMKEVLPIVIICAVGLAVCAALLILMFVRFLRRKNIFRRKNEEYEMDENTLTIKLDKKDLRK